MTVEYRFPAPLVDAFARGDGDTFLGWQLVAPPALPQEMDLWAVLGNDLADYPAGVSASELAQFYENENGRPYLLRQLGQRLAGAAAYNGTGEALGVHPAQTIFTTVYHGALEASLQAAQQDFRVIIRPEDAVEWGVGALPIVKLRGDLGEPDTLLLTGEEYQRFRKSDSRITNRLLSRLSTGVTLFLGFCYRDPGFRLLLDMRRRSDAPDSNAFLLHFNMLPVVQNELRRQGFKLLDLGEQRDLAGRQAALGKWLRHFNGEVAAHKQRQQVTINRPATVTEASGTYVSNLPARPDCLVGRETTIEAVVKLLREKRSPVVLEGSPGMGTVDLAKEIAHDCHELGLFEAYIWWNTDYEMRDLDDLLELIGRQLGHPLRGDHRDPQAIYQLLQQRRCLLVANRITPLRHPRIIEFLKGVPASSSVLVTTPAPMKMGVQLAVEPLSREASVALIRRRAAQLNCDALLEADERALEPLCEVAGGEPQALMMAVGLVKAADSLVSLSELADEVVRDRHNALYGAACKSLDPDQKALLNVIVLSEESISLSALRQIQQDLGRPFSEQALMGMIDVGLVRKWPTRLDTRLKPASRLMREYCRHRLDTMHVDEKERLLAAMAAYYGRQCEVNGYENWEGYDWLEENLAEVEAALKIHLRQMPPAWRPLRDLLGAIYYFLGVRGYWPRRIRYGERALEGARWLGDRAWEATVLVRVLGWTRVQMKDYEQARRDIEAGLKICKRLGDAAGLADGYRYLGALQRRQQNYEAAQACYEQALAHAQEAEEADRLRGGVLLSMGTFYYKKGDPQAGVRCLEEALALFQEIGHRPKVAEAYSRLADLKYRMGEKEAALALYKRSIDGAKPAGRQKTLGYNYLGLARLARDQGAYTQARIYAEEAQQLFGALGIADEVQEVADLLDLLSLPEQEADEINPGTGLPQALLQRLLGALTASEQLQGHTQLRALFVTSELALWWPDMPETFTLKNRALTTITYLLPKRNKDGQNALVLLLQQMQRLLHEEDQGYHRLGALAEQVETVTGGAERVPVA